MEHVLAGVAAAQATRDALWRDPPPLAAGCEHDLELLPVIEFRLTVVCRKCGGLDAEAASGLASGSAEFVLSGDSTVTRRRFPDFCLARCNCIVMCQVARNATPAQLRRQILGAGNVDSPA